MVWPGGVCAPLSGVDQGVLHATGCGAAGLGAGLRYARSGRLWGNYRREPAHSRLRFVGETFARTQPAGRGVQMVSGLAALRQRAAFGIWLGAGAHSGLDLRGRAHSRSDSVPAHALPGISLRAVTSDSWLVTRERRFAEIGR